MILVGTQAKRVSWTQAPTHAVRRFRTSYHLGLEFGYGRGALTNHCTRLSILLRSRKFREAQIVETYSPPTALQGRRAEYFPSLGRQSWAKCGQRGTDTN